MFDRFTDHAKKAMAHSRLAALRFNHDHIDAPHMLLALLQLEGSGAAGILDLLKVDRSALCAQLEARIEPGRKAVTAVQLPFTPMGKKVLENAMYEATDLGDNHVGSEHLLLGVLRAGEGQTSRVLADAGIALEEARAVLLAQDDAEPEERGVVWAGSPPFPASRDSVRRLLLISNSTMHGQQPLAHCQQEIRDFLGERRQVLFVPYALADYDEYAARVALAFAAAGHDIVPAHTQKDLHSAVRAAAAVFVGGGNTFRLLSALYRTGLLRHIAGRVAEGMPYIGSSAGTVVATPSLCTTNDMPIVQPPSFTALGLVPFQVNAHYLDPDPHSTHMGETRPERIRQFHEESELPVLGLREGAMLRVEGERMELRGSTGARLFRRGQEPVEFTPPCDLSFLLARPKSR